RRHTRFTRDWSSDVCSSDLAGIEQGSDLREQATLDAELVRQTDREGQVGFRLIVFLAAQRIARRTVARTDTARLESPEGIAADEEAVRQPDIVAQCIDHAGFGPDAQNDVLRDGEVLHAGYHVLE